MAVAGDDCNIGVAVDLLVGEDDEDDTDQNAAKDGQGEEAGGQHNANGDGPEQKGDVQRLLDGGPEPDNGKGAHHTQGEDHVGGDGQNDQSGNHGHGDQGSAKAGRVHDAIVGLFVHQEDKQSQSKGQQQSDHHVRDGDGGDVFQKAGRENVF